MSKLKTLKPSECSCWKCQRMCERPCWGTPEDLQKIIDAGYSNRLMLDWWNASEDIDKGFFILAPALKGAEGKAAPFNPKSKEGCTFFNNGLCDLHSLGLKPSEGKLASCNKKHSAKEIGLHEEVARTWENETSQLFAEKWRQEFKAKDPRKEPETLQENLEFLKSSLEMLKDMLGK